MGELQVHNERLLGELLVQVLRFPVASLSNTLELHVHTLDFQLPIHFLTPFVIVKRDKQYGFVLTFKHMNDKSENSDYNYLHGQMLHG